MRRATGDDWPSKLSRLIEDSIDFDPGIEKGLASKKNYYSIINSTLCVDVPFLKSSGDVENLSAMSTT